jgi:hypothetical protein
MPNKESSEVTRDEIKLVVIEKLKCITDPDEEIIESTYLDSDLEMSMALLGSMALPYSKISKKYGGLAISIQEAEGLKTVGKTIDLVYKRARGQE